MNTATLKKCRVRWCQMCMYVGNNHDAYHATGTVAVTDPNADADNPHVYATVSVERLDRNGEPGVPRVRIETGDQALSFEALEQVYRTAQRLRARIAD